MPEVKQAYREGLMMARDLEGSEGFLLILSMQGSEPWKCSLS